ncbi:hypothetical protein ACTHOQ_09880 [Solibacillus silvestris]|uniref:hypothetical protein n=1 Tax=Solibacillus silvestris TaxID=76853 RepID=UPI003F81D3EE
MKKMKDFHDFEERLKTDYEGMNLENKQHIIQNIIRPTKQKHKAKKLSIGLIASLCLLLAVATAGAMEYTSLTFFKGSGNTVIEVTNIKEEDMEPHTNADEISRKNEKLMEELKKTTPEGKFLYFMDTEAYEQSGIFNLFYLSNPDSTAIKKVEELPSSITQYIHLENTLLENYHLKRGMFLYDLPDTDHDQMMKLIEKLQRQAMEQNRHYGIMQGDLLDEVRSVTLAL